MTISRNILSSIFNTYGCLNKMLSTGGLNMTDMFQTYHATSYITQGRTMEVVDIIEDEKCS